MEEITNHHKILANELLKEIPSEYQLFYKNRIDNDPQGFLQVLAELRTFYLFNNILGFAISRISKPAFKNRDFDLEILINKAPVNIEVYANNEKINKREGYQEDAKLERAIRHGLEKFIISECNIIVLADEDVHSLNNRQFIYNGYQEDVFSGLIHLDDESKCIAQTELRKISASLILNQSGHLDRDKSFKYVLAINQYPAVKLPEFLEEKLKQYAQYTHK